MIIDTIKQGYFWGIGFILGGISLLMALGVVLSFLGAIARMMGLRPPGIGPKGPMPGGPMPGIGPK